MAFLAEFVNPSDDRERYSQVLADGVYGRTFVATRERTRHIDYPEHASTIGRTLVNLYTFRCTGSPAIQHKIIPKPYTRPDPVRYLARIFGRVGSVKKSFDEEYGKAIWIVHLTCPEQCDPAVTDMYRRQWSALNRVVQMDQDHVPGPVAHAFGDALAIDIYLYSVCETHEAADWDDNLVPGINVQLMAHLRWLQSDKDGNSSVTKDYRSTHRSYRALATDVLGLQYHATRDQTMEDNLGQLVRYSYKDRHVRLDPTRTGATRVPVPYYQTALVGQIYRRKVVYEDNPLCHEGRGKAWADDDTVIFFTEQVAKLEDIAEKDGRASGIVDSPWVIPSDGTDGDLSMIKILATKWEDEDGPSADEGDDVQMYVRLTRDERVVDGELHKDFKLWLVHHCNLDDTDAPSVDQLYSLYSFVSMSSLHKMQQLTSDEVVVGIGPSIGSDVLDVDYSATRDQTILEFDGSWNRYTFKILRRPWTTPDVLPFSLRSQTRGRYWTGATGQRYLTNIIGRVRWHRDLYQHNPLLREGRGEMCFELHVKKLQNVSKATSDFYDAQLENLRYIISKGDKRRPGDVDRHWVQPNDSDTLRAPQPVIEITSDGRYRELCALIGDNSRDLLMQVFLVVDTCLFSDGKIFRMWINDYRELTDKELGRGALLRGRPSIGRDTPGLDYHATRDRTIHRSNQVWSRYSYEAHARKPTSHLALKHIRHAREPKNVYNGQLIGQVNRWGFYYEDAPLSLVDIGRACLVYELKCPDGADQETVHIFACQVANLQRIIQEDSITKPGTVVRDWFTDDEGPPFIKVVACGAEAGWDADLGNGGDVRMTVSMTRDIHENGNEATLKEFTAFEALKNVDSLIDDRYREDYLPTRDRSVWYGEQQGSRYSYKRSSALMAAKADPLRTEGLRRSNSKPYRPWIIGAVAEIAATEQSSDRTVTLKCVADDHPVRLRTLARRWVQPQAGLFPLLTKEGFR
ncbi:hypothetical protein B0H11DRAFT_2261641 [Mycena galericulata]|nr:hypothetical protein B0H11DRAFT_2261641 [Mycena galericulata]